MTEQQQDEVAFLRKVLIAIAVFAGALLLWRIRSVLLLAFAASLVAVLLRSMAEGCRKMLPLPYRVAFLLSGIALAALLGGGAWIFSSKVATELATLLQRLPEAWDSLAERLRSTEWGDALFRAAGDISWTSLPVMSEAQTIAISLLAIMTTTILVLCAGYFIAAKPTPYRDGFVRLFPKKRHVQVRETTREISTALRLWLIGQLISMVLTGLLTTTGLLLVGAPSPVALGFIAGATQFVPFVGPIIGAVPGLLVAMQEGGEMLLLVGLVYVVVQQLESNIITPTVQRHMVSIPPAVLVFAVVAAGIVLGPMGVLLAAPLTVVAFVLVERLYMEDLLDED